MILALYGIVAVVVALNPAVSEAQDRVRRYCTNLVQDPGFEMGVSGFFAQGLPGDPGPSEVTQDPVDPLAGSYSLRIDSRSSGQNIWWNYDYGGTGWYFGVSAHLRSDMKSDSDLLFCAMAYYANNMNGIDDEEALNCTVVTSDPADKGIVAAALNLDTARTVQRVSIRLIQSGLQDLRFTMDSVTACLNPLQIDLPMPPIEPPREVR
jgi:hypothetical protein